MQQDLPTRPWEKLGTNIFEFNGKKHLMVVNYYSRFPVIRPLKDIPCASTSQASRQSTAYQPLSWLILHLSTSAGGSKQNVNGITLHCSSPYHHQPNSPAERAVSCKSLSRKALEGNECPYTALWIYRTTPLGDQTPPPHELLFGRKPQRTLLSSESTLKSKYTDDDLHEEANQRRQETQAVFYDKKIGIDKRRLKNRQPVFGWSALKRTWQPTVVLNRPQPTERPQTYTVAIQEIITRELGNT